MYYITYIHTYIHTYIGIYVQNICMQKKQNYACRRKEPGFSLCMHNFFCACVHCVCVFMRTHASSVCAHKFRRVRRLPKFRRVRRLPEAGAIVRDSLCLTYVYNTYVLHTCIHTYMHLKQVQSFVTACGWDQNDILAAGGVSRSEGGGEMSRCSDPFFKYLHGSGGAAGVGGENIC
jgi:hypothetical protein